jgi:hypothetical protein
MGTTALDSANTPTNTPTPVLPTFEFTTDIIAARKMSLTLLATTRRRISVRAAVRFRP